MAQPAGEATFKNTHVQEAVREIEGFHVELLSERGTYMNRCQKIRAKINDVLEVAKERGIPKKELKAIVRERDLRKKAAEIRLDLEKDEQATFDKMKAALGPLADTALGAWAVNQSSKGGKGGKGSKRQQKVKLAKPLEGVEAEEERDLRGNQQRETEREREEANGKGAGDTADRPDAENLAKLGRGKPDEDQLDELTRH